MAIPDFQHSPININNGTAIRVSLVTNPKILFGNTFNRIKGKKSVRYPINPTNIAVPAKVNETGYPARRKIANKTKKKN